MFELFQDTFKCGFNGKVKVKYENSAKRANCPTIFCYFTKVGRIIMHQSKLHALASIMSDEKLTMLCFHGGIQDGV